VIVVDASVAVGAISGNAACVRAIGDRRLVAPHLIDAEVAHAVRSMVAGGVLDARDARLLFGTWGRLAVDRLPMSGLISRVWELRHNLTAYDAMYVACAELLSVPLVTADRGMAGATGVRCRVELVASEPGPERGG
jgi:predicted nucleic acid-binding protein